MAKKNEQGLLVEFIDVGRDKEAWCQRIECPVSPDKIVKAVKRKRLLASSSLSAEPTSDYSGNIVAGYQTVGRYYIVPGSEARSA